MARQPGPLAGSRPSVERSAIRGLLPVIASALVFPGLAALPETAPCPADCRILKIIHGWPAEAAAQDALIHRLQIQGFGGVVCNVSFDHYLQGTAEWASFRRAVQAARDAGFALWLYDERGYPSGSAGGQVLQGHPEWEAEGLLAVDALVQGGAVELALPPGRPRLLAAFPWAGGEPDFQSPRDLASCVQGDRLAWQAPPGAWRILAVTQSRLYDGTHAEGNLHEALPYPNLLRPEPAARFVALTHARYALELGPNLGHWFMGTFTDEPSLMSLFLRRMPWRPLPWSPELEARFQQRNGRTLDAALPALFLPGGETQSRERHDFWMTVGELVASNYFGQIRDACRAFQVPSGGHLLAEEGLTSHVALYGDFFRCLRALDAPSIDCLTSIPAEVPWHIARFAASAADLEANPLVMCEVSDHGQVWRPAGDTRPRRRVTEAEIRGTCNRLIGGGVNCLTSYYSYDGLDDAALRRLNEWVGRCCAWMRGGQPADGIAVVYPAESLAAHFVPGPHWANASPAANRIDVVFRAVMAELFASRREFTVLDSRTLQEAVVREGALEYRGMRWRAVVLPGVDVLPQAAWRKLDALVAEGGLVAAVGDRPASDGREFPARAVQAMAERWLGEGAPPARGRSAGTGVGGAQFLAAGEVVLLPDIAGRVLDADVLCGEMDSPVRMRHRRKEGAEVFLVFNDSGRPWSGTLRFAAAGSGWKMDPATGEVKGAVDPAGVAVHLEPYGALGFRFPAAARAAARGTPKSATGAGIAPVPTGAPFVSRGEWVKEAFGPVSGVAAGGAPRWRAAANLRRGGVDTFLFVRFMCQPVADLREARGVGFQVAVPAGQTAATQLLVILKEAGGGEFLASTPCSLAEPGESRVIVPFNAFTLAGWSNDADGLLDAGRIEEVRVGWGGYYGNGGESVEFSLGAPFVLRPR